MLHFDFVGCSLSYLHPWDTYIDVYESRNIDVSIEAPNTFVNSLLMHIFSPSKTIQIFLAEFFSLAEIRVLAHFERKSNNWSIKISYLLRLSLLSNRHFFLKWLYTCCACNESAHGREYIFIAVNSLSHQNKTKQKYGQNSRSTWQLINKYVECVYASVRTCVFVCFHCAVINLKRKKFQYKNTLITSITVIFMLTIQVINCFVSLDCDFVHYCFFVFSVRSHSLCALARAPNSPNRH